MIGVSVWLISYESYCLSHRMSAPFIKKYFENNSKAVERAKLNVPSLTQPRINPQREFSRLKKGATLRSRVANVKAVDVGSKYPRLYLISTTVTFIAKIDRVLSD